MSFRDRLKGAIERVKYTLVYNAGTNQIPAGAHFWDERGWFGGSEVGNAYEACAIAYACISTQAKDVSNVPLLFLSDPEDPESAVPETDVVRRLFMNPHPELSTRQYLELCMIWRLLRGEAFTVFDNPRKPQVMWPGRDPLGFDEKTKNTELVAWTYNKKEPIAPGELMHDKLVNPYNPFRGLSPLKAAEHSIQIDVRGDVLTVNQINRGGERALLLKSATSHLTPDKTEQISERMRGRRAMQAAVPRDTILPFGIEPVDPKFTASDLDVLAAQGPSEYKICAVYGMNPFLIGRGDSAKYDSSAGIIRLYWERTLIPTLASLESTWDSFFDRQALKTRVRFDRSKIRALQEDETERAKLAEIYVRAGVPWAEVNRRFSLGLDLAAIPGAEDTLVSATMIPASLAHDQTELPSAAPPQPPPSAPPKAEPPAAPDAAEINARVMARAKGISGRIRHARRRSKAERTTTRKIRGVFNKFGRETREIVLELFRHGVDTQLLPELERRLNAQREPLGEALVDAVETPMKATAVDARVSIRELVVEREESHELHTKALEYSPVIEGLLDARFEYLLTVKSGMVVEGLMFATYEAVETAIAQGEGAGRVAAILEKTWKVEANQAARIARTEIGTIFNSARNAEMIETGFKRHQWITAYDELVRGQDPSDEFDHIQCHEEIRKIGDAFSCGLLYPMESGGEPGNVINCRCETLPMA
jgi:HK97 family phage portal protein